MHWGWHKTHPWYITIVTWKDAMLVSMVLGLPHFLRRLELWAWHSSKLSQTSPKQCCYRSVSFNKQIMMVCWLEFSVTRRLTWPVTSFIQCCHEIMLYLSLAWAELSQMLSQNSCQRLSWFCWWLRDRSVINWAPSMKYVLKGCWQRFHIITSHGFDLLLDIVMRSVKTCCYNY